MTRIKGKGHVTDIVHTIQSMGKGQKLVTVTIFDERLQGEIDITLTCIASLPLPRGDAIGMFRVVEGTVDLGAFERDSTISGRVKGKNLSGNGGPNTIRGTSGRDVICGLNGADTLYGLDGADLVIGGNGPDRAYGGDGQDRLDLLDGVGHDHAYGGPGVDVCLTDPGDVRSSCA
jgi:Ca2+-binding RTX toxin-like protein